MEAYTLLRCVAFLGMVVLSLAAAPVPGDIFQDEKTSTLTCAKKCAISCALDLFRPAKYAACIGLCMTSCKIEDKPKPPAPGTHVVQPNADLDQSSAAVQPASSDLTHGCTRTCVSSMSKVMTTNAKLTMGKDTTTPANKPAANDLQRYAEGYVDSCFLSCSKNNKLF